MGIYSFFIIVISAIVCVVCFAEFVLMVWEVVDRYMMKRADYKMICQYMENPVVMINERGEEYWVGYKNN